MRYRAIQEHDRRDPIRLMCRALAVSAAGYYAWRSRPESVRSVSALTVLSAIRVIHQESRETYGSPSIWDALIKQGHRDLYSRLVIGWAMGSRLTVELAEQALTMAVANRTPRAGLLHHSDRGSQYAATSYQQVLTTHGMIPSMSRKGNCWDNACVERFFWTLKREFVYLRHDVTREDARHDIFEYIEVF